MSKLSEHVADYCNSEHFLFLNPDLKEHAEALLARWCEQVGDDINAESIQTALRQVALLDAPAEVRKAFPETLREYLQYLESSGLLPGAGEWAEQVAHVEPRHTDSFRADGSVRGETYQKQFSDVGRNQPCPCGSGRKFKKCCMDLLS
jgi:hypothetical protein